MLPNAEVMIESTMLKIKAHQKLLTSKPGTISLARSINSALMTREKRPSVRMLIGRVRSVRTGLMKPLMRPSTRAVIPTVM